MQISDFNWSNLPYDHPERVALRAKRDREQEKLRECLGMNRPAEVIDQDAEEAATDFFEWPFVWQRLAILRAMPHWPSYLLRKVAAWLLEIADKKDASCRS